MKLPESLIWTIVGIAGGTAKYAKSILEGTKFNMTIFIAQLVVSGFAALMVAHFINLIDNTFATIAAGWAGFVGSKALELINGHLTKRIQ